MGNNNIPSFNMKSMSMVVLTIMFLALASSANAFQIAVVWGQGGNAEGTLEETCTKGTNYSLVKISYLGAFGNGRTPQLNLSDHCDPFTPGKDCTTISNDIKACQALGIEVLLSLGQKAGDYQAFSGAEDAKTLAKYLWDNFLAGANNSGPLGSAILDGIDIEIDYGSNQYFDVLVEELAKYKAQKKLYLTATPHCSYPDAFLGDVISTGLLDHVFVKFYNKESCEYDADSGNATKLLNAWGQWMSAKAKDVYMALPAAADAADSGFVPPEVMVNEVLPIIRGSSLYGGIMLYDRLHDIETNYSSAIHCCV